MRIGVDAVGNELLAPGEDLQSVLARFTGLGVVGARHLREVALFGARHKKRFRRFTLTDRARAEVFFYEVSKRGVDLLIERVDIDTDHGVRPLAAHDANTVGVAVDLAVLSGEALRCPIFQQWSFGIFANWGYNVTVIQ